jgi:hypothetical protein
MRCKVTFLTILNNIFKIILLDRYFYLMVFQSPAWWDKVTLSRRVSDATSLPRWHDEMAWTSLIALLHVVALQRDLVVPLCMTCPL